MDDDEAERLAKINAAVAAVKARYLATLDARIDELARLAAAAGADDVAREDLRRGLHSIAGAAPILGLADLGAQARTLETKLAEIGRIAPDEVRRALRSPPS